MVTPYTSKIRSDYHVSLGMELEPSVDHHHDHHHYDEVCVHAISDAFIVWLLTVKLEFAYFISLVDFQ